MSTATPPAVYNVARSVVGRVTPAGDMMFGRCYADYVEIDCDGVDDGRGAGGHRLGLEAYARGRGHAVICESVVMDYFVRFRAADRARLRGWLWCRQREQQQQREQGRKRA